MRMYAVTTSTDLLSLTATAGWPPPEVVRQPSPRPPCCRGPQGHGAPRVNLRVESERNPGGKGARMVHAVIKHAKDRFGRTRQQRVGCQTGLACLRGANPGLVAPWPDSRCPWMGTNAQSCSTGDHPKGDWARVSGSRDGSMTAPRPASG